MRTVANHATQSKITYIQDSTILSHSEIDFLLNKLARGHLSTCQEEYADLKKVLAHA